MIRSIAAMLALVAALLVGPAVAGAEEGAAAAQEGAAAADPPCHHAELATDSPLVAESVYQVDSHWTRSDDKDFKLAELRGKVRVAAIFFASCEYACPILVTKMKKLQAALPAERRDQIGFLLVSMDVERDDPAHLRAYAERMKLEGDWTLLHGSDADVRELAAVLGIRYRKEKDGSFSHSNLITVLDREGRVSHRSIGLDGDPAEALAAVTALLK